MNIIYSARKINGLDGCYIAPFRFNGIRENGATKVYTDNAKVKELYKGICEVVPIKKPTPTAEVK